jgi:hypothetical protein
MSLKIVVFLGSCREGRMLERVVKMVSNNLQARKHDVTVLGRHDTDRIPYTKFHSGAAG